MHPNELDGRINALLTRIKELSVERGDSNWNDDNRTITRQELEGRVLLAMRERFFEAGAFDAFCREFTEEMIASIERRQKEILNLLLGGFGYVEVFRREVRELKTAGSS